MFIIKYLFTILSCAVVAAAAAQTFPVRPIRLVIGPAPELLPRLVAQRLSEAWGQQVVVDQRPAAGGIIAGELVARATPDGYTWLMSTGAFYVADALYPKLNYNMMRDFAPVTLMATIPFVCVVHPSLPAQSLAQLTQLARAQPGKLNYGSAGNGTTTQLVTELYKLSAKVDVVHVPYKGVVPAVNELLAGQVQMMFVVAQAAVPQVQSGKLRALAVTSEKRSPALPEVPTMAESGLREIDLVGWNGLSVPIRTPGALVQKINADVRRILAQKDLQARMIAAGFDLADTSVSQFAAYVNKDAALYHRIVRESKLKAD